MAVSVTPVIGHVVNTKCALKGSNRWNDLLYRIKSATTSQYSYTSFTYRPIIHRPMWLSLWALDVAIWTIMVESVLQIALQIAYSTHKS